MPNTHSTLTSLFTDIADAIRAKGGTSASIVADAFPTAIASLPRGASLTASTVTPTTEKQVIFPNTYTETLVSNSVSTLTTMYSINASSPRTGRMTIQSGQESTITTYPNQYHIYMSFKGQYYVGGSSPYMPSSYGTFIVDEIITLPEANYSITIPVSTNWVESITLTPYSTTSINVTINYKITDSNAYVALRNTDSTFNGSSGWSSTYDNAFRFYLAESSTDYNGLRKVTVNAIPSQYIVPSGDISILSNGSNIDVAAYATATVSVSGDTAQEEAYKALALNGYYYGNSFHTLIIRNTQSSTAYLSVGGGYVYLPESFFSDIVKIMPGQFAGRNFYSGETFTFANCSYIDGLAFMNTFWKTEGGTSGFTLSFPSCTQISGPLAFSACKASSIYFSILSQITSDSAFWSCSKLTTFSAPSLEYIPTCTFSHCVNLNSFNAPLVSRIDIGGFYYCRSLSEAVFSNCTKVDQSAFYHCDKLNYVSLPACTSIGNYAFAYCDALTNVNFSNVSYIGASAFQYCYSLTTASFPKATSLVNSAFYSCSNLQSLYFDTLSRLTYSTFNGLSKLETISLPELQLISGYSLFAKCSALSVLSFPKLTSISGYYLFQSCYNLLSVYLTASSVCSCATAATNIFLSTPIGGYTDSTGGVYGSIYVPSSLYSQYIVATNWVGLSSRFVSI